MNNSQERAPLLEEGQTSERAIVPNGDEHLEQALSHEKTKAYLATGFVFIFILAVVIAAAIFGDNLPRDPYKAAVAVLERSPLIVSPDLDQ